VIEIYTKEGQQLYNAERLEDVFHKCWGIYSWFGIEAFEYWDTYEDGKYIAYHRLLGMFRSWKRNRKVRRWGRRRKQAWGGWRVPRSQAEKRAVVCAQEQGVKVRCSRNIANLPDTWDDYRSHMDKCWKTQSKRKKQWKETRGRDR